MPHLWPSIVATLRHGGTVVLAGRVGIAVRIFRLHPQERIPWCRPAEGSIGRYRPSSRSPRPINAFLGRCLERSAPEKARPSVPVPLVAAGVDNVYAGDDLRSRQPWQLHVKCRTKTAVAIFITRGRRHPSSRPARFSPIFCLLAFGDLGQLPLQGTAHDPLRTSSAARTRAACCRVLPAAGSVSNSSFNCRNCSSASVNASSSVG